jgi:hypothetical protein
MRAGAINDFAVPVEPHAAWNLDPAQTAAITVMANSAGMYTGTFNIRTITQ